MTKKYACLCKEVWTSQDFLGLWQIRSFFASCFLISRNANCYCSLHTFCLLQYKSFSFLFSVQDNILYNPALLLQRLLQRIQTETLLRLMQQDKSTSSCLVSTLGYPRRKNTVTKKSCGNCNDDLRF